MAAQIVVAGGGQVAQSVAAMLNRFDAKLEASVVGSGTLQTWAHALPSKTRMQSELFLHPLDAYLSKSCWRKAA
jgi:hypothetical protein